MAFLAQPLECAHAALVEGAPRLDALAHPGLFPLEAIVGQPVLIFLRLQLYLPPPQVGGIIASITAESAAVEFENSGRQAGRQGAIVADEEEAAATLQKKGFEPFDSFDFQVVGRLVEEEQLWLCCQ